MDSQSKSRPRPPSLGAFAVAYVDSGLTWMSGSLGAVFGGIAIFAPADWAKVLFLILAILSFGWGAYHVWKTERQLVCDQDEKLRPRVRLDFDESFPRCFDDLDGAIHTHIMINNFSGAGSLEGAQVFLQKIEISQDGKTFERVRKWRTPLPISLCLYGVDEPEKFKPATIPVDEILADLIVANPRERVMHEGQLLPLFRVEVSSQHDAWRFFWEHGIYKLTLRLSSPATKSDPLEIVAKWDGIAANLKVTKFPVPEAWVT